MKTLIAALAALFLALPAAAAGLSYGPFGDLLLRGDAATCSHVAVLLSSASGWGGVEERMSSVLQQQGTLVIGVDVAHYLREVNAMTDEQNVSYDLESLSTYVQKNLAVQRQHKPLLLGYAEGAAIVYASLVQAPAGTFLGGVGLGFRPGLGLTNTFGEGRGLAWDKTAAGLRFRPVRTFPLDLTVIQAESDPDFTYAQAAAFLGDTPGTSAVRLDHASGYDQNGWVPPLADAVRSMAARDVRRPDAAEELAGLPLSELPAAGDADAFAVFISGDGGWAGLDKDVAGVLVSRGIGVVGLDSLKYFWKRRTPEEGGRDLERIIRHYMQAWDKKRVLLIGYSLGADALGPFTENLPPDLRSKVVLAALLCPGQKAELEFHVTDWLESDDLSLGFPLLPVIKRLRDVPVLCVYGQEDAEGLCPLLGGSEAKVRPLPGGHHFEGDYESVARTILQEAGLDPAGN